MNNIITAAVFAASITASSAAITVASWATTDTTTLDGIAATGTTASALGQNGLANNGTVRADFGSLPIFNAGRGYYSQAHADLASDPGAGSTVASDYISFSTTADAGQTIQLTNLSFNWGGGTNDVELTSTFGYRVFANVDGAGWLNIGDGSVAEATYSGTAWHDFFDADLGLWAFPETADGGTVEFRMQLWSSEGGNGSLIQAFNNITLSGNVTAVPEPSSAALLGLGGLALILRRRKG